MTTYTDADVEALYEAKVAELIGYGFGEDAARVSARGWADGNMASDGYQKRINGHKRDDRDHDERVPPPESDDAPAADSGVRVGGCLDLAAEVRDPEFVVAPIFIRGQFVTLTSHPGGGKTTLMTGILAAKALDNAFGPLAPNADHLSYIVSAEDIQGMRNRLLAEAARLRLSPADRDQLNRRLRWVHAESNATVRAIREAIEQDAQDRLDDIDVVFVDTGPALFPGEDENDNVALRNFCEGLRTLTTLPGSPCVVAAWHPSKGATADRLEPRGASSVKGTADSCLTLWREDDAVTLHYSKFRGPAWEPIEGTLSSVDLETPAGDRLAAPVATLHTDDGIANRTDARVRREAILRRLYAASGPLSIRDIGKASGLSRSAAGRHLQALTSGKPSLVERDPVADGYLLTKAGKERARELPAGGDYADVRG